MHRHSDTQQGLRSRLAGAGAAGSTTLSARLATTRGASDGAGATNMFSDVPDTIRLQMELVACASASPEAALEQVIALLVPGDPVQQAAITTAISSNEPLREQWERAWLALRN